MKNFKLRDEKSFIKILKEPPTKKKDVNYHRIAFFSIVAIGLFYFVRKLFFAYFLIFADGQIELPKQTINFADDIKLLSVNIQEGSEVAIGDTLFTYKMVREESDNLKKVSFQKPVEWIVKAKLENEKKIHLIDIEIISALQFIKILREEIDKRESLLLVGVNEHYNKYKSLQEQEAKLYAEIESLDKEMAFYKSYQKKLLQNEYVYNRLDITGLSSNINHKLFYVSPFKGTIGKISFGKNEICYRKQELMTIHKMEGATVNAFFNPYEIPHIKIGDEVSINFPDGSKSYGYIYKFHVSTYALPSEFQKKFEPTERNIVAEIKPLNEIESKRWKNFYKMDVEVRKNRYNIL